MPLYRNHAEMSRSPIREGLRPGARAIKYCADIAQVSDSMLLWVLFRLSLSTMFRSQNGSQSGLMRSHLNYENIQVLILCYV